MAGLKLGVLGGTFDPIHIGHLVMAQRAREQLALDRVLLIPAGDPWRKAGNHVSPALQRLEMVRLGAAGDLALQVDDREIRREGPTYTVDTLRELHEELTAEDELYFLVGQDALADMPFWHEPAGIAEAAWIVVAPRPGVELPQDLPFPRERLIRLEMPLLDISSTELRQRAAAGLSLRYLVPDAVAEYIAVNRLYDSGG